MEEAVGKLTAWVSSRPNWPYALVQLHEGACHVPLPKDGHLGVLPQRGAEVTPCRQISQLEICQLLISGLQVTNPVGLNGCEEPIMTSLSESLANSISLTRGEPIYLKLTSHNPQQRNQTKKVPPIGELSTTVIASPHKSILQNWKERAA